MTRGPIYVSAVITYSQAYDATNVINDNNVATALSAQTQIIIALIGMFKKPSVQPIVLAKRWGITPEKTQKT